MSLILPTLLLLSASQSPGGGFETIYQWEASLSNGQFANSVSTAGDVDGDGFDDVIIGIRNDDQNGLYGNGSAMVYSGANGSLLHHWSGVADNEGFGWDVSTAGDVNADGYADLIVGLPKRTLRGVPFAGSAIVYSGATGAKLYQWNGAASNDGFGFSVSSAGDANADGFDDVIIGGLLTDFAGVADCGTATLYSGADGSVLQQWGGLITGAEFGNSVSGGGDVNMDGYDDVIVSNNFAQFHSYVWVFSGYDGRIIHQIEEPSEPYFAWKVSHMEDLNGDGHDEIIVANLYAEHHNLYDAGSVYVYSGSNASMLFRFDGQEDFEYFGHSASSAGDVNGDGIADIVVGSSGFDGGAQYDDRGAVSIFSGADGSLLFNQIGAQVDDHYGYTVAGAGDVNANGFDDIIAGTPWREAAGHFAVGMANVIGLNPYLSANFDSVSAASGGALRMDLDFPTDRAFLDYKVLMSATGVGPTFFGVDIPLTQDALTVDTYYGNYPTPNHYNMHGTLNADGNSNATLTIPSGLPISLIGNTYFLAAIAFPQGLPPEISSVAISVTITP